MEHLNLQHNPGHGNEIVSNRAIGYIVEFYVVSSIITIIWYMHIGADKMCKFEHWKTQLLSLFFLYY
jgi:hypothetical protein